MGVRKPRFKKLQVAEVDGAPTVAPDRILFPNGSVTDNSDGTVTVNPQASQVNMTDQITTDNVIVTTDGTSNKVIQQANATINTGGQALSVNADNKNLSVGAGADFYLYHDGADSYLRNDTGHIYLKNTADDKDIIFQVDDGSSIEEVLRIDGSGKHIYATKYIGVGIDPTHAITLPNNDDASGTVKANSFLSYSSARYKSEIKTLEDPMSVLEKINGVSFKWKNTGRLDYGFIAEEVGRVLPNIVCWEDNKKDAQGMDYLKIISFLVEAVKKQQKQIDELNQKVDKT
tara:strand:- start:770 stop:1633 length:864 start_codon:yes stop_codon:yes gene_type:complete